MAHRIAIRASVWAVALMLAATTTYADDIKEVSPDAQVKGRKSHGKLCTWKSSDGLKFNYRVPKRSLGQPD